MRITAPFQGAILGVFAFAIAGVATAACSADDPGVGITGTHQQGNPGMVADASTPMDQPDSSPPSPPVNDPDGSPTPDASAAEAATEAGDDATAGPITSFTLIDTSQTGVINGVAVTGYDPLRNGSTFSLGTVGTQLSIRANVNITIGSALFAYDQTNHTENAAPYVLCGDNGQGTISNCNLTAGPHTLTVTPYTAANLGGTALAPRTITFTITP
jgi:hypothetical protein